MRADISLLFYEIFSSIILQLHNYFDICFFTPLNHLLSLSLSLQSSSCSRVFTNRKRMANSRSFFMYCFGDFSSKLSIPTAFADKYPEFLRQVSVELETESGRSWDVKIKKMSNKWFIADGWSEFATDNKLVEFNLLIFHISGESALDVSIFRNDFCLEEPHSPPPPPSHDDDRDSLAKTWRFVKKLKKYNFAVLRMDIPVRFVRGTGITTRCNTQLEDAKGRRWPVTISDRGVGVFGFTRGWIKFLRGNNFQVGSYLLFEFVKNSNKVVKVVQIEKEVGKKLCAQARKGGILCPNVRVN